MTDEAKEVIRDFYVDVRSQGYEEDAPVPVTTRKLEAIVRLAEASARLRLSDTIETEDADRVINLVRETLEDLGINTETDQVDADVIETGQSKAQRELKATVKEIIEKIESEYDEGAPIEVVLDHAKERGIDRSKAEHKIEKLRRQGDVYEPTTDHLRSI
jgi:replicative DNA helicase Mcm